MNRDYSEYLESLGFAATPWVNVPAVATAVSAVAPVTPTAPTASDTEAWATLQTACLACTNCQLSRTRSKVVFGVGNPRARLMFVGEGPGIDEDAHGEPFVGKAGQLLNRMIEAMGLQRGDVYITNIVKCLPPGNRNPEPDEIAQCYPYIKRQIELVAPEVIVGLGSFAAKTLLASEEAITRLRGKFHPLTSFPSRRGSPAVMMPTFHPAFLLRNPEMKKPVWDDLKMVMAHLEGP